MTTIRSFQSEIEEIHDRHVAQQREHAKELQAKQQELKASKGSLGAKDKKIQLTDPLAASGLKAVKNKVEIVAGGPSQVKPIDIHEGGNKEEPDIEADLKTLLLLPTSDLTTSSIKAHLAPRLLRAHGELIVPFGKHQDLNKLYHENKALSDEEAGYVGDELEGGEKDLERISSRLIEVVKDMEVEAVVLDKSLTPFPHCTMLIRTNPSSIEQITELRMAVIGNVDAGKSTMLGVLTRGGLDDGRGKARVNLFRHKHEIESGRTSSVGMEILGFTSTGQAVIPSSHTSVAQIAAEESGFIPSTGTSARREKLSWDEICKRSAKVVSFIDLAGHERYLKTTIFGMTGCSPDYAILMVGGNAGLIGMSKEHLAVTLALNVPVIVCITKIDMTPPQVLETTKKQLTKILKSPGCRRTPVFVESERDVIALSQNFVKERFCPVFCISNVTGAGLPHLRSFLNLLPSSSSQGHYEVDAPLEYSISDVFSVPFVGTVVSGVIHSGVVKTGDTVLLGPDSVGQYVTTAVKSIQRKRASVESAEAGQSVSFALKRVRRAAVRKGMVILAKTEEAPKAVRRFEGQILVLYHNTTIQPRYQAVMHCGSIRQTARILSLDHPRGLLRTGDRANVTFELVSSPEYLKEGMKLLFREGKTKGLGVITKIL
ncbi:GTP-binding protein GP-1 [Phaffia rhodozyma]|uniref:GTP-binding protein GP-1 n=1 Tax=Phaffia rhodozyma TaxID=264483 RepID=A0A0F7SYT6_PHARH|nr:GTP-binding protein GP-1 [Phaffia rhodozyma]